MRLHWYIIPLCLLLSGCVLHSAQDHRGSTEDLSQLTEVSEEQIPLEVRTVGALITNKLRGNTTPLPVGLSFAPQGKHIVEDSGFPYSGASFQGMDVVSYETQQTDVDKYLTGLIGFLRFARKDGQRAAVAFVAQYEVTSDSITILNSKVVPVPPATP